LDITERWTVCWLIYCRKRCEISHGIISADTDTTDVKKRIIRGWLLQVPITPTRIWICTTSALLLRFILNQHYIKRKFTHLTLDDSVWAANVLSALFLLACRQEIVTATNKTMQTADTTTKIISKLVPAVSWPLSCMVMNITTKIMVNITPNNKTSRDDNAYRWIMSAENRNFVL